MGGKIIYCAIRMHFYQMNYMHKLQGSPLCSFRLPACEIGFGDSSKWLWMLLSSLL